MYAVHDSEGVLKQHGKHGCLEILSGIRCPPQITLWPSARENLPGWLKNESMNG